jgi:alpha-N-arabinofuranosidase
MYSNNFVGAIPVAISGNSPQPAPKFPPGGDEPKTSSGSPTYPLDIFAALSADKKFLIVSVVNATDSEQKFDLNVSGTRVAGPSTLWQLTGATVDAANRVGQPPQVEIKQIETRDSANDKTPGTISVAPISVNIYRFPITQATQ